MRCRGWNAHTVILTIFFMETPTQDTSAPQLVLHPFVVRMLGARVEEARAALAADNTSRHSAASMLIRCFDLDMHSIYMDNQGKIFEDDDAVPPPPYIARLRREENA